MIGVLLGYAKAVARFCRTVDWYLLVPFRASKRDRLVSKLPLSTNPRANVDVNSSLENRGKAYRQSMIPFEVLNIGIKVSATVVASEYLSSADKLEVGSCS